MQIRKQQLGPYMEQITGSKLVQILWLKIGKGVHQGCLLSPCLFNLNAEYIMQNARLGEAQVESRLLEEISIASDIQMTSS